MVIACQLLVFLFESPNDVLQIVEESLFKEIVVVVHLKEGEHVSFTNHAITVHVKHLEGKLFQNLDVLCRIDLLIGVPRLK